MPLDFTPDLFSQPAPQLIVPKPAPLITNTSGAVKPFSLDDLTPSDLADCRINLNTFIQTTFHLWTKNPFLWNWHHDVLTEAFEAVVMGDIKRLIITIPPRYSKTDVLVFLVAWALGLYPDSEFIFTSFTSELAERGTYKAKQIVTSDAYQRIFPWIKLRTDSTAKGHWKTAQGGDVYGTGVGGTITGLGGGKFREGFGGIKIVDDAHKPGEALSDEVRKGVIKWYQETFRTRGNDPANTPEIVMGQRLHEEDLPGWLLAGGTGENWEHINLPAYTDNDYKAYFLGRTKEYDALWPRKHTRELLDIERKAMGSYNFVAQYQQDPLPPGGAVIKNEWWKFYEHLPPIEYSIITADTAQKAKEQHDWSVFALWGKAAGTETAYLIDLIRGKWEAPELKRRYEAFVDKHIGIAEHNLRSAHIEDKSSGTGLIQEVKLTGKLPVLAVQRGSEDKRITRVMDATPAIEAGRVFLPTGADYLNDFLEEMSKFSREDVHKHDDQVDTMADGVNILLRVMAQAATAEAII